MTSTSGDQGERSRRGARPAASMRGLLALLAVLVLLIAACGGSDDDADSSSDSESSEEGEDFAAGGGVANDEAADVDAGGDDDAAFENDAAADEEVAQSEDGAEPSTLGSGGARVTPTAADLGRQLIFTATVSIEVTDVAAASAEATAIIEELGGFLFGQNTTGGAQASSELTFKVLPDDFNTALERLGTVGELRNQSITTDDVTERIVDLGSRIQVSELGVARLRTALEETQTLADYAEVERLLLDREADLELMRGQLRTLQDRVDLATITLVLTQDRVDNAIEVEISSYEAHDNGESCPGQDGFGMESGSDVTICFDIINVGDQTLTNIVLTDTVLGIDAETDLLEIFGTLDELAPGQSVLVAYETRPERDLRLRTRVVAIPTDGVSSEQAGPSVSTQVTFDIRTFEPDDDPGFGDGFGVAVSILQGLWVALKVTIGFLIPLLILVPFIWLGVKGTQLIRRRMPKRSRNDAEPPETAISPPPPPAPPSNPS